MAVPDTDLALLDDPAEWGAFSVAITPATAQAPAVWESSVVIEGMHCANCAGSVEAAVLRTPGVLSAQVSAASHRAAVRWQQGVAAPSAWMAHIQQAGYGVLPALDVHAVAARKREKRLALWRWAVAGLCSMQVMMYAYPAYFSTAGDVTPEMEQLLRWASWVLTLPVLVFSCSPYFESAWRDVRARRIGMDVPVAIGIAITFVTSSWGTFDRDSLFGATVYFDSLTMFVFFLLSGRALELRLRDRTAGALETLINRMPQSVERCLADDTSERIAARWLAVGDRMRVSAGEVFAADGVIESGSTEVDEALLSGESRPLLRSVGDAVLAGSNNLSGTVVCRVTQVGGSTRYAEIAALMVAASTTKPDIAALADRIARPFLIIVLLLAAGAGAWWWMVDPQRGVMTAVAILVVTCPCALSLATPTAMLAAAGALARAGVLVRKLGAIEVLARVDTFVFDKTGTLTGDSLALVATESREGLDAQAALAIACALAQHSLHPASRSLVRALAPDPQSPLLRCTMVKETAGQGVQGVLWERASGQSPRNLGPLRLGSAVWCGVDVAQADHSDAAGVRVYVSDAQGWLATFVLGETLRPGAAAVVAALQAQGAQVQLLSGDRAASVAAIAQTVGIATARGDCSPADKLATLQALQAQGRVVAMVGDGLNDTPALAAAAVSFAFSATVAVSQVHADFVVLGQSLEAVLRTRQLAQRTMAIVRQNLWWALVYNAACVPAAVMGYVSPGLAGLGMALSSLFVVLNALRLARQVQVPA